MNVKIEEQLNLNELMDFITVVYKNNADLIEPAKRSLHSKLNKGIFSFRTNKGIVAVCSCYHSIWHPNTIYVNLSYDFYKSSDGTLTEIIRFLKERYSLPLFFFQLDDRFSTLMNVLSQNEFTMIRQTDIVKILPQLNEVEKSDQIYPIASLTKGSDRYAQFILLCIEFYKSTHQANPVGNHLFTDWEETIFDDLLTNVSSIWIEKDKVMAFSLIYEGDEPATWELGWVGALDDRKEEMLCLFQKQCHDALKQGICFIEKENDSTDPFSQYVVRHSTHHINKSLFAFKEN